MLELTKIRQQASSYLAVLNLVHLPLIAGIDFLIDGALSHATLFALVLIAVSTVIWWFRRTKSDSRYTLGVSFILLPAIIVDAFAGHPWQIDMHMYFFAALAILAIFCDWRLILIGAGVVATHHLCLNYFLPTLVFPEGPSFARVLLHAVVLLIEATALLWLTRRLEVTFAKSERALTEALEAKSPSERFLNRMNRL